MNSWDLSAFDHAPRPKAKTAKSIIVVNVDCDPAQAIAGLGKIETAAKSALAAVDAVAAAAKKLAADEAGAIEQADLDHADRMRRIQMLTDTA